MGFCTMQLANRIRVDSGHDPRKLPFAVRQSFNAPSIKASLPFSSPAYNAALFAVGTSIVREFDQIDRTQLLGFDQGGCVFCPGS